MSGDGSGQSSNVGKHGDQSVGWRLEASGHDGGGAVGRENLQLLLGIGAQIGLGTLDAGVAEPQRDFANVTCRRQRVHGAGMAQHVRRDPFSEDRRLLDSGNLNVFGQSECEPVTRHGLPVRVEKYLGNLRFGADRKPCAQRELGLLPERQDPFAAALSHDVHGGQGAVGEIAQL